MKYSITLRVPHCPNSINACQSVSERVWHYSHNLNNTWKASTMVQGGRGIRNYNNLYTSSSSISKLRLDNMLLTSGSTSGTRWMVLFGNN
jgi:hypothetical protein